MSLRARPARWFEVLVPRPSVARSIELLAASGCVQLEKDRTTTMPLPDLRALGGPLETYRTLRQRYFGYWPEPRFEAKGNDALLEHRLALALEHLQLWVHDAAPQVERIEALRRERHELQRLAGFLELVVEQPDLDLGLAASARPPLASALIVLADHAELPELAEQVLVARADGGGFTYLLALGPEATVRELQHGAGGRETRLVALPRWLAGKPAEALAQVTRRIEELDGDIEHAYALLSDLGAAHQLPDVLGELRRLEWLARNLEGIPVSDYLARVTGWTSAANADELAQPLQKQGIAAVLNFIPAPRGMYPPTLVENPWWARPFELFVKLAGTPGRNEADPTLLLAFIAPLLFGYMFGDVGQGAVLLVAGLALRKRWPMLGMLVPGGVLAMLFGLLFGSVFCREGVFEPLWLAPLDAPLTVLALPLAVGALLIFTGLLLGGIEERWAGRGRAWLESEAGIVALYAGLLLSFFQPSAGMLLAVAGMTWFVLGAGLLARRHRLQAIGTHVGELLERLLQLAVNTVSFVRVGAFAIAHAGLAAAVASLAHATGNEVGAVLIQLAGNALILALEGLVVSVQTTRLILFEFFVRFLRAEGRPFRALMPPSAT